jgi:hypothetical protein
MKLKQVIDSAILSYPSLFRTSDYETSRLLVLNQIFLVIGNGYEWCKDGYLFDEREVIDVEVNDEFFKKDLQIVKVEDFDKAIEYLKERNIFYYQKNNKIEIVVEGEDIAEELIENFSKELSPFDKLVGVRPAGFSLSRIERLNKLLGLDTGVKRNPRFPHGPYPISGYSAVKEILKGKTNSLHNKNFSFKDHPIKEDWLEGAVDVCEWALEYYQDDKLCEENTYHPNRSIPHDKNFFDKKETQEEIDKLKELWGYKKSETVEEKCNRNWKKFKKEQIKFLEEFITKFKNN